MTTPATQMTLALDSDPTGATEIIEGACPACRSQPAPLRRLTTKIWRCRFCAALCQMRDTGELIAIVNDPRVRRGSDLPRRPRR